MFNSNISLGSIDVVFNNISGLENDKSFKLNGSINIGISINGQLLNKVEPLLNKIIDFDTNKFVGKNKIQKSLDECELLEIEVRKARLLKQLEQLRK